LDSLRAPRLLYFILTQEAQWFKQRARRSFSLRSLRSDASLSLRALRLLYFILTQGAQWFKQRARRSFSLRSLRSDASLSLRSDASLSAFIVFFLTQGAQRTFSA